jgi:glutaredoxin
MNKSTNEKIRVFWMPGCTSCVKVKEFLTSHGVSYEPVNACTDPNAAEDLRKLGAGSVPIVARGNEFVFGQELQDVATFLGLNVVFNRLPPVVLMDRWFYFLETAQSLIADLPLDQLEYQPLPDRDRSVKALAYHIFQVPEALLENIQNGLLDLNIVFETPVPDDVKTTADIVNHGSSMTDRLRDWWKSVENKKDLGSVDTFYGKQPLHSFMERSTWHTAQHVRQLSDVLDRLKANVTRPISKAAYVGLPMPEVIWA